MTELADGYSTRGGGQRQLPQQTDNFLPGVRPFYFISSHRTEAYSTLSGRKTRASLNRRSLAITFAKLTTVSRRAVLSTLYRTKKRIHIVPNHSVPHCTIQCAFWPQNASHVADSSKTAHHHLCKTDNSIASCGTLHSVAYHAVSHCTIRYAFWLGNGAASSQTAQADKPKRSMLKQTVLASTATRMHVTRS